MTISYFNQAIAIIATYDTADIYIFRAICDCCNGTVVNTVFNNNFTFIFSNDTTEENLNCFIIQTVHVKVTTVGTVFDSAVAVVDTNNTTATVY